MKRGVVEEIYIGPEWERPMKRVPEAAAVAGRGLKGDRYFRPEGTPENELKPKEEITLIESEGIEAAAEEAGIDIAPEDTRRNIVTRGVALNDLVGKRFSIGEVVVEALEPNPPCNHLVEVSGKNLLKPLIERGGIRGRIVSGGTIRELDRIAAL